MDAVLYIAAALSAVCAVLLVIIIMKLNRPSAQEGQIKELEHKVSSLEGQLRDEFERSRRESAGNQKDMRSELTESLDKMNERLALMTEANFKHQQQLTDMFSKSLDTIRRNNIEQNDRQSRIIAESIEKMQQSNEKKLDEMLHGTVEDCVNQVGVDLNTASAALLEYVSGITKTIAKNIVTYREENGQFTNRKQLLKVAKLGPKAFEQCAGFMRIQGGKNPLDATSVHPESYKAAEALLKQLGHDPKEIAAGGIRNIRNEIADTAKLAKELSIGEPTLLDIVSELEKPARDPREEMPKPILRTDVLEIKDLKPGMILKGTVRNVIDFGAFVDIGVHQDGLVHVSQMTDRYIKHPLEAVSVGDIVEVKVLAVDVAKKRISLTMKIRETK